MTRLALGGAMLLVALAAMTVFAGDREKKSNKPSPEEMKTLQTIALYYKVTEAGLELNWSPASIEPSGGIKVTSSAENSEPLYPYDGYVVWLPGTGHSSCVVPLAKAASDNPRYYRVCSVRADNHSAYVALSNVVLVPPVAGGDKANKSEPKKEKIAAKTSDGAGKEKSPGKVKQKDAQKTKEPSSGAWAAASGETALPTATLKRPGGAVIAGHECTDVSRIPLSAVEKARKELNVWYGHTSHGSQITSGMQAMNRAPFQFNRDGAGGALRYYEVGGDLGHNGDANWVQTTRNYLDGGGTANVIVWSWCGGMSDNTPEGVARYLSLMDKLEADYPGRVFVYMTGHLDGSGEGGNLNKMNNLIRTYCRQNGKVLFDFADIESFDPAGKSFLDKNADDGCNYRDGGKRGNWAKEWLAQNPESKINLPASAAHTEPLNGALKGRAFWWLLARLSGWQP